MDSPDIKEEVETKVEMDTDSEVEVEKTETEKEKAPVDLEISQRRETNWKKLTGTLMSLHARVLRAQIERISEVRLNISQQILNLESTETAIRKTLEKVTELKDTLVDNGLAQIEESEEPQDQEEEQRKVRFA